MYISLNIFVPYQWKHNPTHALPMVILNFLAHHQEENPTMTYLRIFHKSLFHNLAFPTLGRCLLLNSALIFVLILRYVITKLRNMGGSYYLPLDNHIYIHKVVGIVIFVLSWIHALMHITNLCESSK